MKKIVSFMLVLTLILNAFTLVSAEQNQQPKIIVKDGLVVPDEVIQDIIRTNPDAGQITLLEYGTFNKNNIEPYAINTKRYFNIVKNVTKSDILVKDSFVTSVAKGQSKTLSASWTESLSCSISGEISSTKLGISKSISKTYTKTDRFDGPPENSPYNSREFRVKFYQDKGTYTADWIDGNCATFCTQGTESGSYTEPTYFYAYSVDRNIR